MKKKILLMGFATLLLCGCGKIPTLSNGEEAVVTFSDGKKISANQFYEEIKNTYGLSTMVSMIDKYIYEAELKDMMSEAKEYSEQQIKQLQSYYKTEEELLSAIKSYYGFQTIDAFKESMYLSYLQNEGAKEYVKSKLTEEELKDYYENDIYPNMTISHILITADVTEDMDEDATKKEEDKAKKQIEDIIKELDKAKKNNENIEEKFASLAKKHSEDESSREDGGNLGEINIGSLDTNYDELVKEASKLKDGEYSTEVITTELGYHVILKTKTGEKASYDDSLDDIKKDLAEEKLANDSSLAIDSIRHYRDKYGMEIIDSEIEKQYSIYMNNLINGSTTES